MTNLKPIHTKLVAYGVFSVLALSSVLPVQAQVAQQPLMLGMDSVLGSLTFLISNQYATSGSLAHVDDFNRNIKYLGYFDSEKCYVYDYKDKYFKPSYKNSSISAACNQASQHWHGNFMNWAFTTTADVLRLSLTGGYRYKDTETTTILQKSRNQNTDGSRSINKGEGYNYKDFTPIDAKISNINASLLGEEVEVVLRGSNIKLNEAEGYKSKFRFTGRVQVCVPGMEEENCKHYPAGNSKPEGLIQEYAERMRFSVFSYLNDKHSKLKGGVMRAEQKYVGPTRNPQGKEWSEQTGVFHPDPDQVANQQKSSWFASGELNNSGVINYINKFAELGGPDPSEELKTHNPISELYYSALRYYAGLGSYAEYNKIPPVKNTREKEKEKEKLKAADYFPVLDRNWGDPIKDAYTCQKNSILGIASAYTQEDSHIPDAFVEGHSLAKYLEKIFALESIQLRPTDMFHRPGTNITGMNNPSLDNRAYIAGLAYFANTADLRPELAGRQSLQTYWLDIMASKVLLPRHQNQYWLATKYGGFEVPEDFYHSRIAVRF